MNKIWETYKIPLVIGGISIFSIIFSIVLLVKSTQTTTPIQFSTDIVASKSADIKVDVEGAVKNPGMYSLPEGSRVEDAIVAAGGVNTEVDAQVFAKTINRAMKLVDGAKIFIPSLSMTSYNIQGASSMISVNMATQSELESLSGIGPATAKKIIEGRPYQTLEELVTKKAIGTALFEKLKNDISL